MVGVPRSRGCLACREQKKKCWAEGDTPPCVRCKKRQIKCEGYGKTRIKFMDESKKLALSHSKQSEVMTATSNTTATILSVSQRATQALNFAVPSSASAILAGAFARGIDPSFDTSVHLPLTFGIFLNEIPKRLGTNPALDGAAAAVVNMYSHIRNPQSSESQYRCLRSYSSAVSVLRKTLASSQATEVETLAAISLIVTFEVLSGRTHPSIVQHLDGAAQIFKLRGPSKTGDNLEELMRRGLRCMFAVILVLGRGTIFTAEEWTELTVYKPNDARPEEEISRCACSYGYIFHQTRELIKYSKSNFEALDDYHLSLLQLLNQAIALKAKLTQFVPILRDQFESTDAKMRFHMFSEPSKSSQDWNGAAKSSNPCQYPGENEEAHSVRLSHALIVRAFAVALSTQALVNLLLAALDNKLRSYGDQTSLNDLRREWDPTNDLGERDNFEICKEIIKVVRSSSTHRPFGTLFVPFVLTRAWAALPVRRSASPSVHGAEQPTQGLESVRPSTADIILQEEEIQLLFSEHETDFPNYFDVNRSENSPEPENGLEDGKVGWLDWIREHLSLKVFEKPSKVKFMRFGYF